MRLIDADKATAVVGYFLEQMGITLFGRKGKDLARTLLLQVPTADAVEVVRCKDCKDIFFDDWYKCFSCANLYGLNEEVKPNDFCSHGERKESE